MLYKMSKLATISTYHNIRAFQVIWKCKFNLKGGSSWHCMSQDVKSSYYYDKAIAIKMSAYMEV